MKYLLSTIATVLILTFTSCDSESKVDDTIEKTQKESEPVQKSDLKVCSYNFDAGATKISWKSFKTSAKVAVGGTFNTFFIENTITSNSESAVFENATFKIVTSSVNTGNEERDPKLIKFFFNQMVNSDTISGGIQKISEAIDGKGAAVISVSLNGQTHEENATYTLADNVLTLSATLNMSKWNASNAITSLNNECKDLHTGDDGISKLWEEVDIEITTILLKKCK